MYVKIRIGRKEEDMPPMKGMRGRGLVWSLDIDFVICCVAPLRVLWICVDILVFICCSM